MFSNFPGGWPGLALLLLRVVAGSIAVLQGLAYLGPAVDSAEGLWLESILAIVIGTLLCIGLFTSLIASMAVLATVGFAFSWLPKPALNLLETRVVLLLMGTITAAIVLLGPGALSVDARLFGRREIIIPPSSRPPRN